MKPASFWLLSWGLSALHFPRTLPSSCQQPQCNIFKNISVELCVHCKCRCPWRPEGGVGSPWAWVVGGCELWQSLLGTENQPWFSFFSLCYKVCLFFQIVSYGLPYHSQDQTLDSVLACVRACVRTVLLFSFWFISPDMTISPSVSQDGRDVFYHQWRSVACTHHIVFVISGCT